MPLRLLLFVLCLSLVCHAAQAAPFVSAKGYVVTPAPNWAINKSGVMGTDVIIYTRAAGGFAPNLNVLVVPAKPGETLEMAQGQIMASYPHLFMQFKMGKTGFETVGGQRALLVTGSYAQGGRRLALRQDIVLRGGRVYTFTNTVPTLLGARYAPIFNQMIRSVRWSR